MKKIFALLILLFAAALSFAENVSSSFQDNSSIFIEGKAISENFSEFFLVNFQAEAASAGFVLAENKEFADFVFKFDVADNSSGLDNNLYILNINLINNADSTGYAIGEEIISFDFYFSSLDEMYAYNRFLFFNAISIIPPPEKKDFSVPESVPVDDNWKNKRIYLRASVDYLTVFYKLQNTGLFDGTGIYSGDFESPTSVFPMDKKILSTPGITVGAEFHFFDFLCAELNMQFYFGDFKDNSFITMAPGADIKVPLRIKNFVLSPYGTVSFPLNISPSFKDIPHFAFGGGVQAAVKGGKNGMFFIDIKYLYSPDDTLFKNPYTDLFPTPDVIHYNHSVLGFSFGYKFGFVNRK